VEARSERGEGESDLYGTPLPPPKVLREITAKAHLERARFAFARVDADPAMSAKVGSSLVAALQAMESEPAAVGDQVARVGALTAWAVHLISLAEWGSAEAALVEAHRLAHPPRKKHDQTDRSALIAWGPPIAALVAVVCQLSGRGAAHTATWLSPPFILGDPSTRSHMDVHDSVADVRRLFCTARLAEI
jgi:hypothetical protein